MESVFVDPEPGTAEDGENTPKTVLRPKNPGESLKIATTVLRRRDRNLKAAAERAAKVAKVRRDKMKYEKGKINIIRAEKFVQRARFIERDHRRLKHVKKKTPKWPKPPVQKGSKVIAVMRNGRPGGSPEVKSTLRYLNLKKKNHLAIVRNTPENKKKMLIIEPFAYWGPVSFKTCFNLVHKKAMFKAPGKDAEKVVLCDNVVIETHLGNLGCLCTEDLAEVLHKAPAETFDKVRRRLWAFEMDETRFAKGMVRDETWTYGNQEKKMDTMLSALLGN